MVDRKKAEGLVAAFERAVTDFGDLGTIPEFSDDREEQRAITVLRSSIRANYTRARNRLLKELTE